MRKTFSIIFYLALLLLVTACGDFGEKAKDSGGMTSDRYSANCTLRSERFKEFLKENVGPEIECLKANLDIFLDLVYTPKPGYLSKKELIAFINSRDVIEDPQEILKSLDGVFSLAHVMFGGEEGYISRSDLVKLTNFAKALNLEAIKIYDHFKKEYSQYSEHKIRAIGVSQSANKIKQILIDTYTERSGEDRLDIIKLIDSFGDTATDTKEQVKDFLYIKRYFVGGATRIISNDELRNAFNKIPTIAEVMFDLFKLSKLNFLQEKDRYDLFEDNIVKFRELMYFHPNSSEVIITMDELKRSLRWFEEDLGLRLSEYGETYKLVKKIFLKSESDFKASDFKRIEDEAKYVFGMGKYFIDMYSNYASVLNKPDRLSMSFLNYQPKYDQDLQIAREEIARLQSELLNPNLSEDERRKKMQELKINQVQERRLDILVTNHVAYRARFNRIVRNYRYFQGAKQDMPTFFGGYQRYDSGAFVIGALEYVFETFFEYVEAVYPCNSTDLIKTCPEGEDRKLTLHLGQINKIIYIFKEFLYDAQVVLKSREDVSAETTTLMSSLFQNQSNNNGLVDVYEAVEFAVGVFAVAPLGEELFNKIKVLCQNDDPDNIDEYGRVKVSCFRANFFNVLWADRDDGPNLRNYLPKLFSKVGTMSSSEKNNFVFEAEQFTRPCKDKEYQDIPIARNDVIGVMGGLYNVESTVNRYDFNNNDIMDSDEVEVAYKIYEPAIKGIIEEMEVAPALKTVLKGLDKQIFQYLIAFKTVPDTKDSKSIWNFVKFLLKFDKKSPADRSTIMAILKTLSLQSKSARNSTFDCKLVANPPSQY
jgi:hypothetical protein